MDDEEFYEYGYRLKDGREVWGIEHGTDGTWTPMDRDSGVRSIDLYDGSEVESIRAALAVAGVEGVVLRRLVTTSYGPVEEV